jgi:hypothetical protein
MKDQCCDCETHHDQCENLHLLGIGQEVPGKARNLNLRVFLYRDAEPFVSQLIGLLYGLSAIVVFRIVRDQFAAFRPGSSE